MYVHCDKLNSCLEEPCLERSCVAKLTPYKLTDEQEMYVQYLYQRVTVQ